MCCMQYLGYSIMHYAIKKGPYLSPILLKLETFNKDTQEKCEYQKDNKWKPCE